MLDFYRTRAGKTFFEVTLPALARALERLAIAVEVNNELLKERITKYEPPQD